MNILKLHFDSRRKMKTSFKPEEYLMKIKILLFTSLFVISSGTFANEPPNELALLREQIKLLSQRLDQLESNAKTSVEAAAVTTVDKTEEIPQPKKSAKSAWYERIAFKADFRDRYEYIDEKGKEIRQRNRVRLRAQFDMAVSENFGFTLGMATGADDPVSTNQSLDDAFSTKDLRLNLAYYNWKLNDEFTLIGGKMKNPFYIPTKNPIFWDGDLNPEGFALAFDNKIIKASLVVFDVEERKAETDTLLFGGQIYHPFKINEESNLLAGLGYYDYDNIKGNQPLFDGKPKGNTLDENGDFANDFNTFEVFVEYKTKLSEKPLSIYANYYQNTKADELDTAYTAGFLYGKVKGTGSWNLGLAYLDVEADAVFGLFNDSDFAGGNTDSKGMILKAGYGLYNNMSLGLTYIDSEIGQSQLVQTEYDRLQLDYKIKFK